MNHHDGSESAALLEGVTLEHVPCPLGCQPNDAHVLTGRDLLHDLPGKFDVVRCQGCGLMRTSPRPTADSIGAYYPADYGPYMGTRVESPHRGDASMKARLVAVARKIFDTKAHALPRMQAGRLLEVGCASGSFLHEMHGKGWNVTGIEYSPDAAAAARKLGYNVHVGAVEGVDGLNAGFDLIVGWMVLEHFHQPLEALHKLAGWAKPGGMLAVSVPNAGSMEFRVFSSRWYALQLPTHLSHFQPATVRALLNKAGWEVVSIHHHRTISNLVASCGYWLRDKGFARMGKAMIAFPERGGRMGALLLFPLAWLLALMGQTGRMTIWARRKQ